MLEKLKMIKESKILHATLASMPYIYIYTPTNTQTANSSSKRHLVMTPLNVNWKCVITPTILNLLIDLSPSLLEKAKNNLGGK